LKRSRGNLRNTLLVDIGNTRIKWARFDGKKIGRQQAASFAGWGTKEFARNVIGSSRIAGRILVSSVAGSRVNRLFGAAAREAAGIKPEFVASQRRAGGVTTSYIEPWRLGVDRFVMAIGAHGIAKRRAVCIVSIGTTLTIDLVDAEGRHRGGAIVPSPPLMVKSLLTGTNGIRRRASGGPQDRKRTGSNGRFGHVFARTTRTAIEHGSLLAAAATIDRGVKEAHLLLGEAPLLLVAGGGATPVAAQILTRHRLVPDLVLQGLAVLAAEGMQPSRGS